MLQVKTWMTILAICLVAAVVPAVDYYVDPTGSDITGTGSSANPWATIQHAVNNASIAPIDTIFVAGGTYNESITIDRGVVLSGAAGAQPILQGNPSSPTVIISGGVTSVTLQGLAIDNSTTHGVLVESGGGLTIQYSDILTAAPAYGIWNEGPDTVLATNNFWGATNGPDDDAGVINGGGAAISLLVDADAYWQTSAGAFPSVLSVTPYDPLAPNPSSALVTNASSALFRVAFDQSVTGVDLSDFALDSSYGSGAITGLTQISSSVWEVTVSTGLGDGILSIDIQDDDTIVNLGLGVPLGGAGAGNGAFTGGGAYTVDFTPPVSIIDTLTTTSDPLDVSLSWNASDNLSLVAQVEIFYTLDGGAPVLLTNESSAASSGLFTLPGFGQYEFFSIATDNAGNVETKTLPDQVYDITDTVPPSSTITALTATPDPLNVTLTWNSSDNLSRVAQVEIFYSREGGPLQSLAVVPPIGTNTFTLPNFGYYEFFSIATDNAGNVETKTTPDQIYDISGLVPYVLGISTVGTTYTNTASVTFLVSFSEGVGGVDISDFAIDADYVGATISAVSAFTPSLYQVTVQTAPGEGRLSIDLIDNDSILSIATGDPLGGATAGSFFSGESYTVDFTAPVSTITNLNDIGSAIQVELSWNSSDNLSPIVSVRIDYRVNGGAIETLTTLAPSGTQVIDLPAVGSFEFFTIATDAAGNVETKTLPDATYVSDGRVVYEPFDYPTGFLTDVSGGAWDFYAGTKDYTVTGGSLAYPGLNAPTGGRVVQDADLNLELANLTFPTVPRPAVVYLSFLLRVTTAPAEEDYFIGLSEAGEDTFSRGRVYLRDVGGAFQLGTCYTTTDTLYSSSTYNYGSTHFVVLKVFMVDDQENLRDRVDLYINRDPSQPETSPSEASDFAPHPSQNYPVGISQVNLRQTNEDTALEIDELRVGLDYRSVTTHTNPFTGPLPGEETSARYWQIFE